MTWQPGWSYGKVQQVFLLPLLHQRPAGVAELGVVLQPFGWLEGPLFGMGHEWFKKVWVLAQLDSPFKALRERQKALRPGKVFSE